MCPARSFREFTTCCVSGKSLRRTKVGLPLGAFVNLLLVPLKSRCAGQKLVSRAELSRIYGLLRLRKVAARGKSWSPARSFREFTASCVSEKSLPREKVDLPCGALANLRLVALLKSRCAWQKFVSRAELSRLAAYPKSCCAGQKLVFCAEQFTKISSTTTSTTMTTATLAQTPAATRAPRS